MPNTTVDTSTCFPLFVYIIGNHFLFECDKIKMADGYDFDVDYEDTHRDVLPSPPPARNTPDLTASPPRRGRSFWNPPLWRGRAMQPPSQKSLCLCPCQCGLLLPPHQGGEELATPHGEKATCSGFHQAHPLTLPIPPWHFPHSSRDESPSSTHPDTLPLPMNFLMIHPHMSRWMPSSPIYLIGLYSPLRVCSRLRDPLPFNLFHHLPSLYSQSQIILPTLRVRFPTPLFSLVGGQTDAMKKNWDIGYWEQVLRATLPCLIWNWILR